MVAPWGILSSACGFVSSTNAMTPTSTKLHSAEWVDLSSVESYLSKSQLPGKMDPPRSGAVSFSTPNNEKLFTFGGYAEMASSKSDIPPERYVVNDLWEFLPYKDDTSAWGWSKVMMQDDDKPGPRLATAIAVTSSTNNAVLLGGWDPQTPGTGGVVLDDVELLDLDKLKWSPAVVDFAAENNELTIPGGPTSRHVAVTISDSTICLHNHRCDDHVLLLSIDDDGEGQWQRQPVKGDLPPSLGLHCAATLESPDEEGCKGVVIFGGASKDGNMINQAYVLDVKTWKWTKLDCSADGNDIPSPRAGACMCSLDENSVLLFGGATPGASGLLGLNDAWALHIDMENGKGKWQRLVCDQDNNNDGIIRPPQRNAATLTPIDSEKLLPKDIAWKQDGGEKDAYYMLQGGWYPFQRTYDDVFVLRVSCTDT